MIYKFYGTRFILCDKNLIYFIYFHYKYAIVVHTSSY